eukprot:6453405-Amphidinium_carterae.1
MLRVGQFKYLLLSLPDVHKVLLRTWLVHWKWTIRKRKDNSFTTCTRIGFSSQSCGLMPSDALFAKLYRKFKKKPSILLFPLAKVKGAMQISLLDLEVSTVAGESLKRCETKKNRGKQHGNCYSTYVESGKWC